MTTPGEPEVGGMPHLPAWLRRLGYYGLALLFVAVAALLRGALSDVLKPTPTLVFYLAWVGAAAFGGLGPGLLATATSWLCIELLFEPPLGHIDLGDPMSIGRLVVLLVGGLIVSVVGEKMRRSRRRERRQGRELRVANAALRASETGLAKAQAIAHLANWEVDIRTNVVRGSDELYRLFNLEPDFTLDAYVAKFHPEDRRSVVESMHAAIHNGKPYRIDYRIIPRPGEVRYVHAEGEVRRDGKAFPLTFFGTVQDITERKRAEEVLRESEERLHLALGAARMGVWQWEVGTEHVMWSPELYPLLGYEPGSMTPTHQAFRQRIHPQDLARWEQAIRGSMERCEDYACEFRVVWADGSVHWVESRGQHTYTRDAGGAETLWMRGVLSDIGERKKVEEALRAKDAELEVILTRTPFMLTRCSRDLHYRYVSRAYAEMIGRTPEEVAGKPILEIMGAEGFETIRPHVEAVLQGQPVEYEAPVHFPGAGSRFLRVAYVPDRDEQGQVMGWIASILDITERKQAEEALRESEEKYRRIVETATEGIAMADAEARMIFVNDRWSEIFGYSPEEAAYITLFDLVFPEDAARMKERWESRKRGQDERYEWRYRRKDDRPVWVLASVAPRFGPAGEFLGTLVLNTDITERKQAEEALRESEARLRVALDAGRMGTWVWDLATDTVDTDPLYRRLWDLDDTDVRVPARVILEKIHPADRTRTFDRQSAQQRVTGPVDVEFRIQRRDGSITWLQGSAVPIRDAGGTLRKVIGVNFDITERKRVEESLRELTATLESKVAERTEELERRARQLQKLTLELSEAEERERRRLAEILHDDLQQVLAAAKFHLSRVGSGTGSPEQSQPIVEQVKQMLKDAIEKSRHLSRELSPAVLRQGDLAETFDWLAEQMQAKHGLTVRVETVGTVQARSDAIKALMYRSAQEMLFNVVKHAQVSEARLRVRRRGRYICLSISDRGRGFDPGEIEKTTGFGLLNIRERVALLGGRMKTRSAPGRGTTFHIIVPDAGPPANDAPVEQESNRLALPDHSR